jgi:hypothetical protein
MKAFFVLSRSMLYGFLFFVAACSDGEVRKLQDDLAAANRRLLQRQADNYDLSQENSRLQSKYHTVDAYCENLQVEKKELIEWSRELVRIYGPSVWYIGEYEKPLPWQRVPKATPKDLLRELNARLRQDHLPEVILKKIDHRTAYVQLSDDAYLTQRMGSSGAAAYLNAVTFTLCSLDSIQCVEFDFQEGDHASPGRICR